MVQSSQTHLEVTWLQLLYIGGLESIAPYNSASVLLLTAPGSCEDHPYKFFLGTRSGSSKSQDLFLAYSSAVTRSASTQRWGCA